MVFCGADMLLPLILQEELWGQIRQAIGRQQRGDCGRRHGDVPRRRLWRRPARPSVNSACFGGAERKERKALTG